LPVRAPEACVFRKKRLEPITASHGRLGHVLTDKRTTSRNTEQKGNTMSRITKDQFVAILNESGVTDAQKERLHRLFEQRHPEAHQAFLEWLGIPADQVRAIREHSRK
jgi:hypothetical protein